jgi:two-component system, OmpR family, phosphate regulon response regulator PhoB
MRQPGRVFSRAQLLDAVWGPTTRIDERSVDVRMGRLRRALSKGRERDPIRTVWGIGYAFDKSFGSGRRRRPVSRRPQEFVPLRRSFRA